MSDSSVMFAAKEFTTSVKTVCRFRPFSEFESKRHKGALKCAFDVVDNVVYRKRDHSENPSVHAKGLQSQLALMKVKPKI